MQGKLPDRASLPSGDYDLLRTRSSATSVVTAFAPATVANLGPGFDILGLAIDGAGDVVTARRVAGSGVVRLIVRGDGGRLPTDPSVNTAGVAAQSTLRRTGVDVGVELELIKQLPISSGLGSSAASAVAAAFAVNALVGAPLRKRELIEPCLDAEAVGSGRHGDNVVPALLGGLNLVRPTEDDSNGGRSPRLTPRLDIIPLPIPDGLHLAIVVPDFELRTREARDALPEAIPRAAVVRHAGDLAAFVSACYSGRLGLLGRCTRDEIFAARRAELIPGAPAVIAQALVAGALGSSVSGAGPAIFALCHSPVVAQAAASAMKKTFATAGLSSTTLISPADCAGVRLIATPEPPESQEGTIP